MYDAQHGPGIYLITNKQDGKVYVGSSNKVRRRLIEHKSRLLLNNHHNRYLQRAFNKYKLESFTFEVLEYCQLDEIRKREQYYIDLYSSADHTKGYNLIADLNTTYYCPIVKKQSIEKYLKTRNMKPFKVFSKSTGEFIGEWVNRAECARALGLINNIGNINEALNHKKRRYIKDYVFVNSHEEHLLDYILNRRNTRTPMFIAIDRNGKEYGPYQNQRACAEELNIDYKKISLCLKGTRPRHKGYTFKHI